MCYFEGHIKGLGGVPAPLLASVETRLADTSSLWDREDEDKPNDFACFEGNTRHLVFQYPESLADHRTSYFRSAWEEWSDVIRPIVAHVTRRYGYEEGRTSRIMLARLGAGCEIGRHVDAAPAARVPHKIHVPLVTTPQVWFLADDAAYHLKRGIGYEVNNRVPHGGRNDGTADRIHLIFDYFDAAVP